MRSQDQQNLYGKSPLWHACANGSQELARLLLDVGADKDLREPRAMTRDGYELESR